MSSDDKIVHQTEPNLSDDDLTEQAKEQFTFHTDILQAHQLAARCILNENHFSPVGRHYFCWTLEQRYTNCKNVLNYVASHPQMKNKTDIIDDPLVVCGLPRSGTTLLYNLLAQDPQCRAPLNMDMSTPIPPLSRSDVNGQIERNKNASIYAKMLNQLGLTNYTQETCGSHPAYTYDEDLFILIHAGVSFLNYFNSSSKDNGYAMWFLDNQNKDFAYEYHKIFIQMLNSVDAPTSHWLLKTPVHLLYLDTLLRHYSKASLIMIHRQLDEVLPSCSRLAIAYTTAFFDLNSPDINEKRKKVSDLILHMADISIHRLIEFRRNNHSTSVFDVFYEDLLSQPISTVRKIYDHFGLNWSKEFETKMTQWLLDNPQGKQGRNSYTLEEFGLTRQVIDEKYKEYNNMFMNKSHQCQEERDT